MCPITGGMRLVLLCRERESRQNEEKASFCLQSCWDFPEQCHLHIYSHDMQICFSLTSSTELNFPAFQLENMPDQMVDILITGPNNPNHNRNYIPTIEITVQKAKIISQG